LGGDNKFGCENKGNFNLMLFLLNNLMKYIDDYQAITNSFTAMPYVEM